MRTARAISKGAERQVFIGCWLLFPKKCWVLEVISVKSCSHVANVFFIKKNKERTSQGLLFFFFFLKGNEATIDPNSCSPSSRPQARGSPGITPPQAHTPAPCPEFLALWCPGHAARMAWLLQPLSCSCCRAASPGSPVEHCSVSFPGPGGQRAASSVPLASPRHLCPVSLS